MTTSPRISIIGKAHPDHPEYVRTDALNRADQAAAECACDNEHRKLRVAFRELADELDAGGDHGVADQVRARLWRQ